MTPEQQKAIEPLKEWLITGLAAVGQKIKEEDFLIGDDDLVIADLPVCLYFPNEDTQEIVVSKIKSIPGVRYLPGGGGYPDDVDNLDVESFMYNPASTDIIRDIVRVTVLAYTELSIEDAFKDHEINKMLGDTDG